MAAAIATEPASFGPFVLTVAVSRAALTRRFAIEIGHSPSDYLSTWRMELAAHRPRTADEPVGTLARWHAGTQRR